VSAKEVNESATPIRTDHCQWQSLSTPGVSLKALRSDRETGGSTILLKFEAGASFPAHNHPGGEEVYVIEGDIKLGKHELNAGDYLYTPPEGKHAAVSKNGCLILVSVAKPIEILK
jgi:anti-sigma factor ChrR (cupin superfamily)